MGASRLLEEGLQQDRQMREAREADLRQRVLRFAADPDYHERGKPWPLGIAQRAATTTDKVKQILRAEGIEYQAREQWAGCNGKSAELRRRQKAKGRR